MIGLTRTHLFVVAALGLLVTFLVWFLFFKPATTPDDVRPTAVWANLPDGQPRVVGAQLPQSPNNLTPATQLFFDRPMDAASVVSALEVSPPVNLQTAVVGNTLFITPTQPLETTQNYTFELNKTAQDLAGWPLAEPYRWRISMPGVMANTQFTLADFENGSTLVYRFNYPIDPDSFTLQSTVPISHSISWNSSHTVYSYTVTTHPMHSTTYRFELPATVRDLDGNELPIPANLLSRSYHSSEFIVDVSPPHRIATVMHDMPIMITFADASILDKDSVEEAFTVSPVIDGTMSWQDDSFIFTPTEKWQPNSRYTFSLSNEITFANGTAVLPQPEWFWFWAADNTISFSDMPESGSIVQINNKLSWLEEDIPAYYSNAPRMPTVTAQFYALSFEEWQQQESGHLLKEEVISRHQFYTEMSSLSIPYQLPGTEELPIGIYRLVLLASGNVESEQYLFVTNHSLLHYADKNTLLLTAVDARTNTPLPNQAILLYDDHYQLIGQGQTDQHGRYQIQFADSAPAHVVLDVDGDYTHLLVSQTVPETASQSSYQAHIQTDLPIYYPGQAIQFWGAISQESASGPSLLPANTAVSATLHGPNQAQIGQQTVQTDSFGAVYGQWQLDDTAVAGPYTVHLSYNQQSVSHSVIVQERPIDPIQISLETDQSNYHPDEPVTVTATLRTADGRLLVNQLVTFSLYVRPTISEISRAAVLTAELPTDSWATAAEVADSQLGQYQTDEQGQIVFQIQPDYDNFLQLNVAKEAILMAIGADIDYNGRTHSAFTSFSLHPTPYTAVFSMESTVLQQSVPFTTHIQLLDHHGRAAANVTIQLVLKLTEANNEIEAFELTSDPQGVISLTHTIDQPNLYHWIIVSQNANIYQAHGYPFVVHGASHFGNQQYSNYPFMMYDASFLRRTTSDIFLDKQSYDLGETAQLVVFSYQPTVALVTLTQDEWVRTQLISLTNPITAVELPLTDLQAKATTVAVTLLNYQSNGRVRMDYSSKQIWLQNPQKQLTVTVTPQETALQANGQTNFTVRVTDQLGQPVSAQLLFSLYDAKIDTLVASLDRYSYGRLFTAPSTIHSGNFNFADSLFAMPDLCANCEFGLYLHHPFDLSSVWLPALQTNANGEATFTVTLPNETEQWQFTALAMTADLQTGTAVGVLTGTD